MSKKNADKNLAERKEQIAKSRSKNIGPITIEQEDDLEDLLALYERGEISGDDLEKAANDKLSQINTLEPYANKDDKVYLSLNVQSRDEENKTVTFRMGIQLMYGMEFTGARDFKTMDGKMTRHGTNCKYRSCNGVSLVSMSGALEWCTNGYYYSLMKMEHLGTNETKLEGNVDAYLVDDLSDSDRNEVLGADEAQQIRDFYKKFGGSSTYDPQEHNQVVRGKVLKIMGNDKHNQEITVSADDFNMIEVAVRDYNRYMNNNSKPGEFEQHVKKMIIHDRLLTSGD